MSQQPSSTQPGAASQPAQTRTYTHSGQVFLLGYGPDFYGIWDRRAIDEPVARFPMTNEGWAAAWTQYSRWEPNAMAVQAAVPTAPEATAAASAAAAPPATTPATAPAAAPQAAQAAAPEAAAPEAAAPAVSTASAASTPSAAPELPLTTGFSLPGQTIAGHLGICTGTGSGHDRALEAMVANAREMGADAVLGVRFETAFAGEANFEVLAYGTAVELTAA